MSPALLEADQVRHERRPCNRPGRGITLGQLLASTSDELEARGATDCPVCGGDLQQTLLAAECGDCGSRIL